jgi:hypothetical protein
VSTFVLYKVYLKQLLPIPNKIHLKTSLIHKMSEHPEQPTPPQDPNLSDIIATVIQSMVNNVPNHNRRETTRQENIQECDHKNREDCDDAEDEEYVDEDSSDEDPLDEVEVFGLLVTCQKLLCEAYRHLQEHQ